MSLRIGICCYPTYGGSGAVAADLALALADRGHEVHVVSYERPARLTRLHPLVTFHRVEVTPYPLFRYPPYDLALASVLRDVAEERSLDILHVHYAVPHAVSAVLARDMLGTSRPKIVTTLHGTDITIVGADRAYFRPTLYAIARSDAVTAVSGWLRDETWKVFCDTCKIDVVPNGVDLTRFRPRDESALRCAFGRDGDLLISHVSNLRPVKRIRDVIAAFARVAAAVPARLLVAGDGPERGVAEEAALRAGIRDRVHFLGEQEDVERVYAASDLFLLASDSESFGLAALEAQACGVAVVATRAGGVPEVVEDGVTGLLFPVGDVDAAAAACLRLARDAAERGRFGLAGRARAERMFAEARAVDAYVGVYERVLGG